MSKREPVYYFVAVDVTAEKVDDFSGRLFALGAEGIEERDEFTIEKGEGGKITLVASYPTHALATAACQAMPKLVKARIQELVGDAWRDAWKAYFKPFLLCPEFWISPPWEKFSAPAGHRCLVLEPGRAFGTGLHESTALVAQILYRRRADLAGKAVLDVGMGSGILALVALKLGAGSARGVDVDPDVVEVARENAQRNDLASQCHFDAAPLKKLTESFPIVVANIEADVLIAMRKELLKHVMPGGLLVLSGILETRMEDVKAAFLPHAKLAHALAKKEWVGLAFENVPPDTSERPAPSSVPPRKLGSGRPNVGSATPNANPGRPNANPARADGNPGRPDAKPGRPNANPRRPDGNPGRPDAKPGRPNPKPGRSDVGSPGAKPGSAPSKSAPAKRKPAPPKRKSAPAKQKPAPAKRKPAPAKRKPAPAKRKPAPAKRKPAPAKRKPAPAKRKPAPAKQKPAPAKKR